MRYSIFTIVWLVFSIVGAYFKSDVAVIVGLICSQIWAAKGE